MTATPARHNSPPETTENRGPAAPATAPDSRSPTRGPPVTTRVKTEDIRPRLRSGVTVWLMVVRHTALTESAAPATASRAAAGHSDPMSPASATAAPQTATAQMTITPSRRAWLIQPVNSAVTVAPAETEAYSTPVPAAAAPPRRDRGVQHPRPGGAGVEDAHRQYGEQRPWHPERHRHQVDGERADHGAIPARVMQSFGDRVQHARRGRLLGRRLGGDDDDRPHQGQRAGGGHRVGGSDA